MPTPTSTLVKISLRLALILMVASLLPCKDVASEAEAHAVELGLPLPFIVMDARRFAQAGYPQCVHFGSPRVDPMRLKPFAATLDLAGLMLALMLVARGLGKGWTTKGDRPDR